MAAEKWHPKAIFDYYLILDKGDGIPVNKDLSLQYLKKAAYKGVADAMLKYGVELEGNKDQLIKRIPINKEEAFKYYKKCTAWNTESKINCARMYENGIRTEVNKVEALKYYEDAANLGYSEAIGKCAKMYENGIGTQVDKEEALQYHKKLTKKEQSFEFLDKC